MLDLEYRHVDVFSRRALRGNGLLVVLDAASLDISVLASLDLTRPLASVSADGVTVPAGLVLGGVSRALVTGLAAILAGAEACGLADWATWAAACRAAARASV